MSPDSISPGLMPRTIPGQRTTLHNNQMKEPILKPEQALALRVDILERKLEKLTAACLLMVEAIPETEGEQ